MVCGEGPKEVIVRRVGCRFLVSAAEGSADFGRIWVGKEGDLGDSERSTPSCQITNFSYPINRVPGLRTATLLHRFQMPLSSGPWVT